jgi:hypothetical protein
VNSTGEVNPQSGTEEVCVPTGKALVCLKCGLPFERKGKGPRKMCYTCVPSKPTKGTPEYVEYRRDANDRYKSREKARRAKDAAEPDCPSEVDEERAREILTTERNLRHPRVIEVCLELAAVASQCLGIPNNEHLYRFGVQKTLEALKPENLKRPVHGRATPVDPAMDRWEPGQRIRVHEQWAIWDYSMSWRTQKDGTKVDFERFQELRRLCQTNTYEAGRLVHGKDFAEKPHKEWNDELFVHRNPDLLPEEYGHAELSQAMAAQSNWHYRMLLAARNSLKTTFDLYDLVGWVCTFPDIRILLCSSTNPLTQQLVTLFRKIFIARDPLQPSLFQQLWPEMCIAAKTPARSYQCPMRKLDFPDPTLKQTSAESGGQAGGRATLIVYEDICEQSNVTTPEQREKVIEVYSLLNELLDPGGYVMICGTAWGAPTADGGCGDLYFEILKEEAEKAPSDKQFKVVIAPCWKVKPGVRKEPYDMSLTPDEVDLMYPERLTFHWIKSKMGTAPNKLRNFRQQQLVQWVKDESENLKIQFDPDVLSASIIGSVPSGDTVLSVDVAYSLTAKSDRTSIAAIRLYENFDRQKCMCVLDIEADQMRPSELCEKIAKMCRQYSPKIVLLEKGPTSDSLNEMLKATAMKFDVRIPSYFVQPPNTKNAKFLRIKDLELLWAQSRIKLTSGSYLDAFFAELQQIDGTRSSVKKDDRADSVAQVATFYRIYSTESTKTSEKDDAEVERMQRKAALKAEMDRYFGHSYTPPPAPQPPPEPQAQPRNTPFPRSGGFAVLPSNMRTFKR